jgi:hypothetical protein
VTRRFARAPAARLSGVGLALLACAAPASHGSTRETAGVGRFNRPPGMPIGTGASGGKLDDPEAVVALDEPAAGADRVGAIERTSAQPALPAAAPAPAAVPCAGCLELNVDVSDINQRDEFAFAADGVAVERVVWTVLVNFNSDQLAVQPFIDGKYGKYTNLHVNTFPLGTPVEVVQVLEGKAQSIGLSVGSSGAWTGNQTMSVFIDSVSVEGPRGFTKTFDGGPEGLEPRTHAYNAQTMFHPPH